MRQHFAAWLSLTLVVLLVALGATAATTVRADSSIVILKEGHEIRFGKEIVLKLQVQGSEEISKITVTYGVGSNKTSVYGYPTFTPGREVSAEFALPVGGARYVPPGTDVRYSYLIEDRAGGKLQTPPRTILYEDTRFTWEKLNRDLVTVSYYGGNRAAAGDILETALETLNRVGRQVGARLTEPIRIWVYASKADIDPALPFRSETTQRELVTLGQTFTEHNLILLIGRGGSGEVGETTAHEVTHLIVHQATDNPFSELPAWLSEGLSVYAEGDLARGHPYLQTLQRAVDQDRVIPLRNLATMPGRPDETILLYGEGYSVVRYLADAQGREKLPQLLAAFRSGKAIDDALRQAYGLGLDELENQWRSQIGAKPLAPRPTPATRTDPAAVPTLPPLTLPGSTSSVPPAAPVPTPGAPAATGPAAIRSLTTIALLAAGAGVLALAAIAGVVIVVFRRR